ncbi:MAG: hypothetical protein NTW29_17980 [Bacteroidetes bacterium]|nr:hypothetical protein [Bacteroidota bacterium]
MKKIAASICEIVHDYHRGNVKFDTDHVIKWSKQFQEDQQFILEELLHLLKQGVYISEAKARKLLIRQIDKLAEHFKYKNTVDFLKHVEFLSMQKKYKSQSALLEILDEELSEAHGIRLKDCGSKSKKYALYIDDVLATGGTVFNDCTKWLEVKNENGVTNYDKVINEEKIFIVSCFCKHSWGCYNVKWRLKYQFNNDAIMGRIKFQAAYTIQNHPTGDGQIFNHAYPISQDQSKAVLDFIKNLKADRDEKFAFRNINLPKKEEFFSSKANRIRFENIILNKGVELLNGVNELEENQRPLGMTNPTRKTLGTGTIFFTWRNISNTTPVVFWWEVQGSNWYPLFKLDNRGIY